MHICDGHIYKCCFLETINTESATKKSIKFEYKMTNHKYTIILYQME